MASSRAPFDPSPTIRSSSLPCGGPGSALAWSVLEEQAPHVGLQAASAKQQLVFELLAELVSQPVQRDQQAVFEQAPGRVRGLTTGSVHLIEGGQDARGVRQRLDPPHRGARPDPTPRADPTRHRALPLDLSAHPPLLLVAQTTIDVRGRRVDSRLARAPTAVRGELPRMRFGIALPNYGPLATPATLVDLARR